MADRQQLIRNAFASYAEGDLEALRALFDPQARWLGVPQGRSAEQTACCPDRAAIVGLLAQHYENGRRFSLGEMIEQGDRVAVEFSVANPAWSGPVTLF